MILRVYNVFVKVAIAVLLITTLLLLFSGVLKTIGYIPHVEISQSIRFIINRIQFGSVSDWASAICNLIMAYAAFKAYTLAKDHFSDFVKKDGYELIKKLQLELIPKVEQNLNLSAINLLDIDVQSYVSGGIGSLQDEGEESNLKLTLNRDLESLSNSLRLSRRLEWDINKALDDLEIYGWSMLPDKREELIYALECHHHLFSLVHCVTLYLREILSRDENNFLPKMKEPFIDFDSVNPNSPLPSQDIDLIVKKLIHYQNLIYDNQKSTPYDQTVNAFSSYLKSGKHLKNYFAYI